MAKLTLIRTVCGRWPGGATSEVYDTRPDGPSCETCLRHIERSADHARLLGKPAPDWTWITKRPGLSAHVLIQTWQDADPRLLPKDATTASTATAGVTVTFSNGAGIPGPARNVGESDADYLARIGRT